NDVRWLIETAEKELKECLALENQTDKLNGFTTQLLLDELGHGVLPMNAPMESGSVTAEKAKGRVRFEVVLNCPVDQFDLAQFTKVFAQFTGVDPGTLTVLYVRAGSTCVGIETDSSNGR